ncbi:dual specificity protein phosphatase 1-like isoform X5 [Lycium barbarum]|uniref:dual specificity protein phosphatase 1-like isoform X5 n=1 Tax=Lycium barbarum TaxID=112863 RepID=UPI00293F4D57|nr:dual specificity protein phosphatase 1-like isoform X5 [Lycium barbarum]
MGWKHNMPNNGENMITVQTSNQSNECIIFLQNRRSHNRGISNIKFLSYHWKKVLGCAIIQSTFLQKVQAISRKKPNMAQALEFHRGQIEALMRAMSVAKIIREDKDPCMIEEYMTELMQIFHITLRNASISLKKQKDRVAVCWCIALQENPEGYFNIDLVKWKIYATIVIAYLMKKHGMSHSEAFQLVKSRRPVVSPNAGFMTQLENYDKTLKVEPAPSLCPASLNAALTILKISLHKQVATKQSKRRRSTASLEHFAHEAPVDNM